MPLPHATEDALELYALGLLQGNDLESVEEHLLTCELCRSSVASLDQEISLLRQALQQSELEKRKSAVQERAAGRKLFGFKLRSSVN